MSVTKTGLPVDKATGDHNMPGFMTALYGAIVGVNLSKMEFNWELIWQPHSMAAIELRFQYFLLIFSLVIVAHDWYIFHREKWFIGRSFAAYSFQLGYLLCLCMMLVLCKYSTIMEWYIAALAYTIFNITERLRLDFKVHNKAVKSISKIKYLKYIVHLGMLAVILIFCPPDTPARTKYWSIALAATVVIVIIMWMATDKAVDEPELAVTRQDNLSISINGKTILLTYDISTDELNELEKLRIWQLMKTSHDEDLTEYYRSLLQKEPSATKISLLQKEQEKWKNAFEKGQEEELKKLETSLLTGLASAKL